MEISKKNQINNEYAYHITPGMRTIANMYDQLKKGLGANPSKHVFSAKEAKPMSYAKFVKANKTFAKHNKAKMLTKKQYTKLNKLAEKGIVAKPKTKVAHHALSNTQMNANRHKEFLASKSRNHNTRLLAGMKLTKDIAEKPVEGLLQFGSSITALATGAVTGKGLKNWRKANRAADKQIDRNHANTHNDARQLFTHDGKMSKINWKQRAANNKYNRALWSDFTHPITFMKKLQAAKHSKAKRDALFMTSKSTKKLTNKTTKHVKNSAQKTTKLSHKKITKRSATHSKKTVAHKSSKKNTTTKRHFSSKPHVSKSNIKRTQAHAKRAAAHKSKGRQR